MKTAVAVDWMELHRAQFSRVRVDEQMRTVQLARENRRLMELNEQLRQNNADLTASAEMWIRLYEAALMRANESLTSDRSGTCR
jgi:hypothetical protein